MRKAERKRQLLAHAKQLFVTLGYQNTTTERIAQAAGVSEPVLYRHFDSKKTLFLEVLEGIREATLNRWRTDTAGLTDPLARLHRIADLYLGSTREHALELCLQHARDLGANAIIGLRYDATEIMQGVTEVLCYGTAVLVEPNPA